MGHIIRLDDQLSNKIAAGEVVERPASVVKELLENAVDAGASRIEIEIEEGGLSNIKVIDDGSGISRSDCELAFRRHATSKIENERDLFHVRTLGFRGEALPSIASVSRTEIRTSTGEEAGTHLVVEGGKIIESGSASSRKGTEIEVSKLFFNTPARLKHLKTVHTELGNITETVYRIAIANPGVAIKLTHNGKKSFQSNGNGDIRQVLAAIYGLNTAKKMLPIHAESIDFTVSGWIAKPDVTRASRQHMSIFMNGRYIRNYPVSQAILQGYHTLLPVRRYPIAMVHVDMDPTLIDVNVHPSKLEVRLSKEKELCHLVEDAVREAHRKISLIPETDVSANRRPKTEQQQFSLQHESKTPVSDGIASEGAMQTGEQIYPESHVPEPPPVSPQPMAEDMASQEQITGQTRESAAAYAAPVHQDNNMEETLDLSPDGQENEEYTSDDASSRIPTLYPIGQMHGTYILAHNDAGLYIIDQHAAQERIKYEFYREKVGEVSSEVQELLVPYTFEFSVAEAAIIEENLDELKTVGVFLEPFGSATYLVRSHPNWFPEGFEKETVEELIYQVIEDKQPDVKKLREDAATLMSCKRSIKANHHLPYDQQFALLERLREAGDPFTCPHGRPIIIHFTTYEMEKLFKRVM